MTPSIRDEFKAALTAMLPPAPRQSEEGDPNKVKQPMPQEQPDGDLQSWLDSLTGGGD